MSLAAIALNRFGLGARPGDSAPADPRGWLLAQVGQFDPHPAVIAALPDAAAMTLQYRQNLGQLRRQGVVGVRRPGDPEPPKDPEAEAAREMGANAAQRERRQAFAQAYGGQVNARLTLSLTTATPFAERLVHFWANHFAISTDKLATATMGGPLEFEAIRPTITGRFVDMLLAVTRHPGMQFYLDQAQSIGPNSLLGQAARRRNAPRQPGLNENLAREILELHTLGAGNYTQADVAGLARALTGWSIGGFLGGGFVRRPLGVAAADGQFVFQPNWHEPGSVTVAGKPYRQNGEAQALAILNDLALHPLTARRLAFKLARHFVADAPPPALVERMAAAYLASGGQLPALYQALIDAPEAWAAPLAKFKTPWDWLVSSLRALGRGSVPPLQAIGALRELGQPVWRPGSPAGWEDDAARWAAPDALLRRVEVASRIAAPLAATLDARSLAPRILPGTLSPATASAIARAESPAEGLALLLVAPEFLRR
ncbi:DUF1800 domain-containing protein [Sandarakinorhabdus sp.]|uniref:DUF1800 domain-containing protein n=1 Tax=Sandarakinorhabdus sp. TaxID=1916663 RepID=UPI00286E7CB6|nr:DUF1800 domain-containing protein [Sandarakinorhabdus sp.]